jgi:hypothetical protein
MVLLDQGRRVHQSSTNKKIDGKKKKMYADPGTNQRLPSGSHAMDIQA